MDVYIFQFSATSPVELHIGAICIFLSVPVLVSISTCGIKSVASAGISVVCCVCSTPPILHLNPSESKLISMVTKAAANGMPVSTKSVVASPSFLIICQFVSAALFPTPHPEKLAKGVSPAISAASLEKPIKHLIALVVDGFTLKFINDFHC